MYWIKKNPGDLTVYVANRVRQIQDSKVPIFYVESNNNPSDNVSKIKSVKQYLNTDLWNYGPSYMSESKWYVGQSIEEIKEENHQTRRYQKKSQKKCGSQLKMSILI